MVTTYIFVERAGESEIIEAMLDEGYSENDLDYIIFKTIFIIHIIHKSTQYLDINKIDLTRFQSNKQN